MVLREQRTVSRQSDAGKSGREKMELRARPIATLGRAQAASEFELGDWSEHRIFSPGLTVKTRLWTPGGSDKYYSDGLPFVFRFLPALSVKEPDDTEYTIFGAGRDPETSELSLEMIRTTGFIDRFGVEKQVSFIPTTVYQPEDGYDKFCSPKDNPYKLLLNGVSMMKSTHSLPREWVPLGFNKKEIDAWCEKHRFPTKYAKPILPYIGYRKFAYGLIYRGCDLKTKKEVKSPLTPIGIDPADGLQVICFSSPVYDALAQEYAQLSEEEGQIKRGVYAKPEPALPTHGCLNYVWNKSCEHPVTGRQPDAGIGYGYGAYATVGYYPAPQQLQKGVPLQLPKEFAQWYFNDGWLPWDQVLHGITGKEQVNLIAEFFPELGPVCEQMWDGYDELLEAWEKAPFIKDRIDMEDILFRKYQTRSAKSGVGSRRVVTKDSDRLDEDDYDNARNRRQRPAEDRSAQRSRLKAGLNDNRRKDEYYEDETGEPEYDDDRENDREDNNRADSRDDFDDNAVEEDQGTENDYEAEEEPPRQERRYSKPSAPARTAPARIAPTRAVPQREAPPKQQAQQQARRKSPLDAVSEEVERTRTRAEVPPAKAGAARAPAARTNAAKAPAAKQERSRSQRMSPEEYDRRYKQPDEDVFDENDVFDDTEGSDYDPKYDSEPEYAEDIPF
jgi:hypothetical protein